MLAAAAILIAVATSAFAGCPMCEAGIANAENAAEVAATMNAAILILLLPTFAIIGGLVRLVFKYRHYQTEESSEDSSRSINSYVNLRTPGAERDTQ